MDAVDAEGHRVHVYPGYQFRGVLPVTNGGTVVAKGMIKVVPVLGHRMVLRESCVKLQLEPQDPENLGLDLTGNTVDMPKAPTLNAQMLVLLKVAGEDVESRRSIICCVFMLLRLIT